MIARLCRAFFMHKHLKNGENVSRPKASKKKVIARLCRAFFMHTTEAEAKEADQVCDRCGDRSDCPVMSGFFHSLLNN